ncbi:MAG TPA: tetratricopeptide repeat protein [Pyrinomonadaceae bacterium]|jgi:tetratricopeptide (TPR) repeat protein|nr:tetratricopeptide repeat protein [Pyrinomonadaceae bacterium]
MLNRLFKSFLMLMATVAIFVSASAARAQAPAAETIVVFPFENVSNHTEYNWIGESFSDSLSSLLNKPGLIVVTSDERAVAFQRLHLPLTVLPSRATEIKIGRELKASMIVIGNFNVALPTAPADKPNPSGETKLATITGEARVVRINEGRMAGDIFDGSWAPRVYDFGGTVTDLQKMNGDLAYQILSQRDKALSYSRNQLVLEATRVPPQAFEAFMKGLLVSANDPTREVYLKNAMKLYAKANGGAVYSQAAFELGQFYFSQRKLKEAAEYFAMVQKKEPHYGEAQFYAGLAYWKTDDIKKALEVLVPLADEKVMPLVAVYNNAGAVSIEAARAEKKPEERTRLLSQAITLLSRAADSSPDDITVLFNYGFALFLSEKYSEAADKLEHVIGANPRDGEAYFLLAKTQERSGKSEPANAADNQARLWMQASYAKWQTEWQKSQTIQNLSARSRDVLNQVDLTDLGRRQAVDAAKADSAQESLNKIKDLYQQGRDDEAMVEIRKLLILEPTNAEGYLISGQINQRRGDQEAAIAALKTAIFWENGHPLIDAHILLGRIFLERGDLGEARKYAASAMTIDPNNPEAIALQRQVTLGRP